MIKRFYLLLLAIVASVGMMNAKVTWNSSNISDLKVRSYQSYSKEGVTLSANSDMVEARWQDFGDESMDGISFNANETGGYTFSNTLGKNFTKIEMTLTGPGGWDFANLGSGWSFSWDYMNDKPATVTWTGNASTVDLAKDASDFNGERVKSIVFYFVGDSEEATTAVTGVTLNKSAAELTVGGENLTLIPTVLPSNATNKEVMWNSDNGYVAVVENGGVVIPVGPGTANITVTTVDGDYSATCVVTVTDAAPAPTPDPSATDLASITGDYTAQDGEILTGTLGVNVKISIADGATVTLLNANINGDKTWTTGDYAGLTCLGDATITIVGKNSVSGFSTENGYPGIYVPSGKTLIINGTGSLTAQSSTEEAAGIGAGRNTHCGNIEIQSGKITAIAGGEEGAGIGGAFNADCGNITISGGIVTAIGGYRGAGIGGGRRSSSTDAGHCGNILISGGVVSATSGEQAAAIGGGRGNNNNYKSNCGTITITNTALKVYAHQGGSSTNTIGAGKYNNCGTVTIGGNTGVINDDPYTYRTKEDGEIVVVYINAIGTVVYTQECKDKIDIARELYDALEDSQKGLVTNYQVLLDAEAAYAALIPQDPQPAGTVTVVFEANNNQKEVEVTLPHTFACDFENGNGELDGIIQELYALQYGGYCPAFDVPTATGNEAVTASKDGNNHYIAISEAFEGTATVTGNYIKYLDTEHMGNTSVDYTLTISVQGSDPAPAPANSCGDGLTWELSEGVLTISYDGVGTGEMTDFDYEYDQDPVNVAPWKENKSEITTVIVGDGVKSIGNYAFNDLYESFTAVTIANSVERIGLNAFMNAKWITEITLPSSLKTIDKECFAANFGFTSITIPSGVTSIGNKAFSYCNGLTSLTCEATTPPTLASSVFYKVRSKTSDMSNIPLYVPSESVAAYEAAAQWNAFDVQAIPGGGSTPANSCGDGVIWELNDGALTISYTGTGTGVMDNYASASDAPWYSHKDDITSVTITDGVKSVGSYSFGYYGNLVTVTIGNDVETIGEYAFGDCYKFTTLNLGNSVKHIGNRAFMWAKVLTGFTLPSTLETIGEYAFLQNKLITSLTIPSNVTSIGPSAFMYCAALTSVTVEATTPPTLGETVFEGVPTSSIPLHVPSGSVAAYTAADQWKDFDIQDPTPAYEKAMNLIEAIGTVELTAECKAKIDAAREAFIALSDGDKGQVTNYSTLQQAEVAFDNVMDIWLSGDCDVILWKDTTLTVRKHAGEGNGAMADYNYMSRAPWYNNHWYDPKPNDIVIKSVTIEEGVTHLGDYAFAWMSEMKTVTIPSSVITIPEDAFYWSKAVDDIYLHTNPSDLMWVLPTSADNQFKPEKATLCHVPVDLLPVYQGWLNGLNVTYVGDQTPTIPTLEVGLTLNAMDVFYLGPDTTCFQFNCFSSNKYFFGKGSFRINFESPAENVHTMHFVPKQQGTDVLMMYRDGETFVTYGTNCCATALPTSATVTAGDGTKANPFVLEPDTKGECVQAEWTTLPQAISEITYDGEPHTLVVAGVSSFGTVQYSLDNGASWSAELPQGTDPVTYTIHYRVIGGDPCILGIDYDPNNKVTASIVSPAVKDVEAKIAAIPQPVVYTPACEEAIADARSAYDALDDDLKPFVENYDVLTAAEATYDNMKYVSAVEAKINAIPTTIELKLATRDSIESARAAYEALTDDQKPLVSNYQTLLDAEAALAALNPGGSAPVDIVWDGNTGIANVDPNTTSPAYEGMTVTVGNGSSFSTYQNRLYFTFYSQPNGGYIFANENGSNITKVVIESTTALTSTMTEVDRMGSGWVISNENKTATWTGNADSVSIWKGQSFTNYWVVDKITFTVNGVGATPLDSAQRVKDLIDAIPVPVTLDSKDEIDAARDAYDALADLTKGALDNATVTKLTDAEDAYAALIKEATDVIALINAIPQPVVYNEACGDSIAAAREAYDALSDELKPLVTNYPVLTDAEATYEALAPRIWTSGDCQVIYWPGDSAMIVSKLPGEGNGVMDNYANKNSVPWVDYQLKVKTLTIESGVTEIGSCAFYELRNLEGGLVIPEGVTAIHENGFRNSLKLTSITLPSTITLLGDNADAFNNCKAADVYITADPNKLAWNEDFDDFIYSYSQQDVHKTTVCHVPVDFYEIYVAKFDQTVNVTFVGDLPAALSPAEHAAIEAVKDSIAAIGAEISYPESGAAIDAARSAYDALDDDLMPFVSNYQTLLDAEDAYADAKQAHDAVAAAVVDKINAIPVPVEYSSKAAIDTARVAYDALLITQKALVPDSILQKLTNAEQAWAAIAAKVEHNVSYIGKDGELKNEKVALLHIPDPAPEFNGYEFVRWDVKAGDFLEEGLRIKAIYTPIITTNPQGFDTLAYNGLAQELVKAGVAKEGHIEYSLYPEEPESWSTELPKATIAGVYAIYYKLVREGHADYIAPEPTMATIAKVPVTYVAPTAVESLVYNASNQTLIAAGQTQDGTFEYSLAPTLLDSWKTALPQAMSAGTYSVYYRVQGDLNHLDSVATDPIAVTIAKEELTATADDKNVIYGDAVPAYTVTYAGWQGDDDATVLTGDIAFACEYASTSNVGEYTITPSGVSAANYNITFVNGKVTVAKAESGCIAPVVYDTLVYNGANQTLIIAGQPMGGEMQYSLDTTVLDCWSTSLPQAKDAGTYNVYYRVKGDMNHNDHYYDLITVSIAKAALTATAENKTVTYGDAAPEYTVVYAGWHGTDDASVLTGTIAFACTYTPTSNVGDYTITPSGVDAANYIITFVKGKVTVVKAPLMITADDKNVIYGEVAPAFTASYEGWKNSDDESVVSGLTLTSEYLVTSNVGTYDIVPANASATNYAISYTNGTLTVAKAALTITANDTTMIYGDEHPEFTASYSGWKNSDDESVVSGLAYTTPYAPGSPIGTYTINPNSATAQNYAITFVDGTLTVNKAVVKVANAEAQIAKFEDGTKDAVVLNAGTLEGIKLSDPIAHKTTAEFNDPTVAEQKTITLFYELTGDAALLNNYDLQPTSEIFTTEGVIIEKFIPDDDHQPEAGEQVEVKEGIDVYAYGYCDGSGYSLKYHLNSGNPDQYKIDFADSRFTDVDWTNLVTAGKDGTIDIEIPVDMPTGDYNMTVYFRDSRFTWLESRALTVTFHVNLPETYVKPMFDNTIVLIDTCECFTDIQWYHRNNSSEPWQPIEGATGHYYRPADGSKLTGEYFVSAKMNGMPTYTCGQEDMETLYGADKAKAAKVSAYPNPVVTTTTVTIEGADSYEHTLRIVDLMGNEVENSRFEGNTTTVDMNGYMIGNYLISVDGIVVKVMKQ